MKEIGKLIEIDKKFTITLEVIAKMDKETVENEVNIAIAVYLEIRRKNLKKQKQIQDILDT